MNVHYINLKHRIDRKEHIENQLKLLGWEATRFEAIKLQNPAIGCSMSHLQILEKAINENYDNIIILEDDATFLNPQMMNEKLYIFLEQHRNYDVVMLGGNNIPPYQIIDDTCVKISRCQTTTAYMVNKHYMPILANNIRKGIELFIKNPKEPQKYAIDKFWFSLQESDNWYLIIPLSVTQKPDYSDIEKRNTDYTDLMLDISKERIYHNYKKKVHKSPRMGIRFV